MRGKFGGFGYGDDAVRAFNEARAFCAGNYELKAGRKEGGESFNEARAFCAGNSSITSACEVQGSPFNEARAFCAGN